VATDVPEFCVHSNLAIEFRSLELAGYKNIVKAGTNLTYDVPRHVGRWIRMAIFMRVHCVNSNLANADIQSLL